MILNPMLAATGGSILAAELAYQQGWAINLSGGYHHASSESGGGFCVYADISIAIHKMRKTHPDIRRVMIVDLDAHQGNGHERDFLGDETVFIMDMYSSPNYPSDHYARKAIAERATLKFGTKDQEFLAKMRNCFENSIERFPQPDLLIYNAGTDSLVGDPLGRLSISEQGIIERDEYLFGQCLQRDIPIVMLLSGGYQKNNAEVIAHSILNLHEKFDLLNPKRTRTLIHFES